MLWLINYYLWFLVKIIIQIKFSHFSYQMVFRYYKVVFRGYSSRFQYIFIFESVTHDHHTFFSGDSDNLTPVAIVYVGYGLVERNQIC